MVNAEVGELRPVGVALTGFGGFGKVGDCISSAEFLGGCKYLSCFVFRIFGEGSLDLWLLDEKGRRGRRG